jgi:hypothetical protein
MTRNFTLLLMAATLAAPAFAQPAPAGATPLPGLMGLSPRVTNLLADAGKDPMTGRMMDVQRLLKDREMDILSTEPFDAVKLAEAMKAQRNYEQLMAERRDQRTLEAYLQMTPDERKSVAVANGKLREAMDKMKK